MMKCQNCGNEFTDGLNCPQCGAATGETASAKKTKKPITKKWWFWVIIVVVVIAVLGAAFGGDDDEPTKPANVVADSDLTANQNQTDKPAATKAEKQEGDIGKYNVVVKDSKIVSDYEGKDVLLVTYTYTNNSKESKSMSVAINDKAFQNGVELSPVYFTYEMDELNLEDHNKDIKPGVSFDVKYGYYLNDSETDVEIELSEWISFNDDVVSYVISIK